MDQAALAATEVIAIGDSLARLRIAVTYLWRHHRLPQLDRPQRFTEFVQHRKLFDRDPRLPAFSDKVRAKQLVADRVGADWITPTLWQGTTLPKQPPWPRPFVVKSRHGCNQRAFVRDGSEDWDAIRRSCDGWLAQPYGLWLDEWLYGQIPRGVLVEPFIGCNGLLPLDYKLYVFGGKVSVIQVHLERETRHRWMLFDRNWQWVSTKSRSDNLAPPVSLDRMIGAAETLAQGFDFVRIDFYEVQGQPRFGEMTFYPGSGLDPFDPPELDLMLGQLWSNARG
ncbi:ATP-grasp fold amidoligase family protein [Blastomonas sp.]|uniref:ATP-grasp fold amidoligase family protein n=1 Tax=Blastomonas sp. TaxID=1909299 RepID=UPI003594522A